MRARSFESIGRVVEQLQAEFPDVTISSLRFLEREGLLRPSRTAGGHRVYTTEHVERIRQIKRWQAQRLSLVEIRERLKAREQLPPWPELAGEYRDALLAGATDRAIAVVKRAHDTGATLVELAEEVFQPALYEIGRLWERGEITVAQEHQVSATTRDLLAYLAASSERRPSQGRTALAACVPGERHDLGLKMVTFGLELAGWQVHYLGADVPAESILSAIRDRRPDLLIMSITMDLGLTETLRIIEAVRSLPEDLRPRIQVGGQAVERLEESDLWPVEFVNRHLSEVLDRLLVAFPADRAASAGTGR